MIAIRTVPDRSSTREESLQELVKLNAPTATIPVLGIKETIGKSEPDSESNVVGSHTVRSVPPEELNIGTPVGQLTQVVTATSACTSLVSIDLPNAASGQLPRPESRASVSSHRNPKTARSLLDRRSSLISHSDTAAPHSSASSAYSIEDYSIEVDKNASDIYSKGRGLYVGKRMEYPNPPALVRIWNLEVRPRLLKDLFPVIQKLPKSLSRLETVIEPELCMAGNVASGSKNVRLMPTIWIRCGSKKCLKKVQAAVDDLTYIRAFSHGTVHVGLAAPRPAGSQDEDDEMLGDSDSLLSPRILSEPQFELIVKQEIKNSTSGCGLRLNSIHRATGEETTRTSIIGGLIRVDGDVYGLTTAHPILPDGFGLDYEQNNDDTSTNIDSSSEGDEEDFLLGKNETHSLQAGGYPPSEIPRPYSLPFAQFSIGKASLGPFSFASRASRTGDMSIAAPVDTYSDFALIKLGMDTQLANEYNPEPLSPDTKTIEIDRIETVPNPGPIHILCRATQPVEGYLLEEPSFVMQRGGICETRKLQLEAPLAQGCSGSWVVRGPALLGHVISVYEDEPYVHMIPIKNVFSEINDLLHLTGSSAVALPVKNSQAPDGFGQPRTKASSQQSLRDFTLSHYQVGTSDNASTRLVKARRESSQHPIFAASEALPLTAGMEHLEVTNALPRGYFLRAELPGMPNRSDANPVHSSWRDDDTATDTESSSYAVVPEGYLDFPHGHGKKTNQKNTFFPRFFINMSRRCRRLYFMVLRPMYIYRIRHPRTYWRSLLLLKIIWLTCFLLIIPSTFIYTIFRIDGKIQNRELSDPVVFIIYGLSPLFLWFTISSLYRQLTPRQKNVQKSLIEYLEWRSIAGSGTQNVREMIDFFQWKHSELRDAKMLKDRVVVEDALLRQAKQLFDEFPEENHPNRWKLSHA